MNHLLIDARLEFVKFLVDYELDLCSHSLRVLSCIDRLYPGRAAASRMQPQGDV